MAGIPEQQGVCMAKSLAVTVLTEDTGAGGGEER